MRGDWGEMGEMGEIITNYELRITDDANNSNFVECIFAVWLE
jgi:hypothetical protein